MALDLVTWDTPLRRDTRETHHARFDPTPPDATRTGTPNVPRTPPSYVETPFPVNV